MRSIDNPSKTARASASCAPLQMLLQACSDSMSASTMARKAGSTRSNESGKLIPSRRGQESQVAACGSHSPGIRYRSAAGVFVIASIERQGSTLNAQPSMADRAPTRAANYIPKAFREHSWHRARDCSIDLTMTGYHLLNDTGVNHLRIR